MKAIRVLVLSSLGALALPASAPAFLLHYTLTTDVGTFVYNIVEEPEPHWTLTVGADEYQGQALDTARFSGETDLSFTDSTNIKRNGQTVEAQLKGKISGDCGKSKITLKDATNDVSFTLDSADATGQTCSGNL